MWNNIKTICFFGDYGPRYSRNKVLIRGFRQNGIKVLECNTSSNNIFVRFFELFRKHYVIRGKYDVLMVGYSPITRSNVFFGWIFSRKMIIWDAFFSLYESWVFDKKVVNEKSIKSLYYWTLDWICVKFSSIVLLDTIEHINYFKKTFKIKKTNYIKVIIGADDSIFHPSKKYEQEI